MGWWKKVILGNHENCLEFLSKYSK